LNVFASDNAESIEVSKKFLRELDTSWHILALFCHGFPSKKLFFLGQKAGSIHAVFDARAAGGLTHPTVDLGEISDISWGFFGGNITSNQEYAMGYNWWILPI
jgi:hypothetical protein